MNIKIYLLLPFVLCLTAFNTSCSFFSPGPSDTVKNFYYAVEAGKIDEAADLLSDKVIKSLGYDKLKQGLVQQTRNINSKGGMKTIQPVKEEIIGETAQVVTTVTFGNGETMTETINLIKEDGEWRIDMTSK